MDDVTALRAKADECRRLARESLDPRTVQALTVLAAELDAKAALAVGGGDVKPTLAKLGRAAVTALNTVGVRRHAFWSAFASGLAAPTMVYDPPPAYASLTRDVSVAGSFARVGALLSQSAREIA